MGRFRGAKDQITHFAFDTQTVTTSTTKLTYFAQDLSAGQHLTNMKASGRFPSPESFQVKTLGLVFDFDADPDDVGLVYKTAFVTLFLGKSTYIEGWPLALIPPSIGLASSVSTTATTTTIDHFGGATSGVAARTLHKVIQIDTDEPFRVVVEWGSAPSGLGSSVVMKMVMGGMLTRQVQ